MKTIILTLALLLLPVAAWAQGINPTATVKLSVITPTTDSTGGPLTDLGSVRIYQQYEGQAETLLTEIPTQEVGATLTHEVKLSGVLGKIRFGADACDRTDGGPNCGEKAWTEYRDLDGVAPGTPTITVTFVVTVTVTP